MDLMEIPELYQAISDKAEELATHTVQESINGTEKEIVNQEEKSKHIICMMEMFKSIIKQGEE